jgi:D-glycero-D-manno-heptose 1,7-bisphosphate phosphatase
LHKFIVLDRDGVINEDSPFYIKSPDEWHAIPGSLEAIVKLENHGCKIAIATNQSGVARGYFTKEILAAIHNKMLAQIRALGGSLQMEDIFICPHAPNDNCECRKPKSGLILEAAAHFKVDPKGILFIGDTIRDFLAAKACGASFILVKTGKGMDTLKDKNMENMGDFLVYNNLAEAVDSL